ncbi:MAG: SUMF1/EgtB/PvdO family nonheme iron enzyme [Polyangiaceae bacterium]
MRSASLPAVAVTVLLGCGADELPATGQVLLYLDTDAPLPPPSGQAVDPDQPAALFDTARVDILAPDGDCPQCSHEFSVDRQRMGVGASLGVLTPTDAAGYVARVRLFRVAVLEQGEPRPDSTIERTVALPEAVDGRIEEIIVFLPTDSVAHPFGTQQEPVDPEPGPPTTQRAGTWPGAQPASCTGVPREDEVCIPGGAYWMGNPRQVSSEPDARADEQRLVVISPFFLDRTEVTVGQFRTSGLAKAGDPRQASGTSGDSLNDWCTYTVTAEDREGEPLNCVSWTNARAYCLSLGKDLPKEAQFEYAASGLRGSDFVWGGEIPACGDAVFGRAGIGALANAISPCNPSKEMLGPLPAGSGARDVLAVPTGTVFDLAGNLSEFALDQWNRQDEACWGDGVFHDPVCETPGELAGRSLRSGNWAYPDADLLAASRYLLTEDEVSSFVGFRCARSGR